MLPPLTFLVVTDVSELDEVVSECALCSALSSGSRPKISVCRQQTPYHHLFVLFLPDLLRSTSSPPQVAGLCVGTAPALNLPTSVSADTHTEGHCSVPNLRERLVLQFNLSVYYDQSFIKITKVFKYFALTLCQWRFIERT